jgi:sigma-54 specific flagellar transcriptional regulator A
MTVGSKITHSAQKKLGRLVGISPRVEHMRNLIARVSKTDATVLIQGESGTGKEVIANLIHDLSDRARSPFIAVNCGAIPAELIESELFGHEKGAFTGAIASRKGRFELAEGGTLFLDEIGDMPFAMQVKLLRVLQERSFERVGGARQIRSDVRVIAATHQDLNKKIEQNHFRADLFYRLSVFPIDVPPLRERTQDISLLIESFLSSARREGRGSVEIATEALLHLESYEWPGNIRELSNLVQRLIVLHPSQVVGIEELPSEYLSEDLVVGASNTENRQLNLLEQDFTHALFAPVDPLPTDGAHPFLLEEPIDLKARMADLERDYIIAALEQTDWVTAHAANWLKLQRTTLVEKMRKYDIKR